MQNKVAFLRTEELIKLLIDQKALLFGEFTLKSGVKSPYYINMAKALKTAEGVASIGMSLAGYVYANFLEKSLPEDRRVDPSKLFIFGPAYKGIPLATATAFALYEKFNINVRWGFNRKEAKLHGDKDDTFMMGDLQDGDSIIILDDVITSGATKLEAKEQIETATGFKNLKFIAVVAVLDRFEGALEIRQQIDVYAVLRMDQVMKTCKANKWVTDAQYTMFDEYFKVHGLVQKD
ncbi:MAG: orotate phosphoribosyltransferase [Candidatus Sigynarchaeum springense]